MVASLLALVPALAAAQQLTSIELNAGAVAALARRTFVGAEVGLAHRPSAESRIAFAIAGGMAPPGEQAAARARLTIQLLVNSTAQSGLGVYAGVGTVFEARRGFSGQGYLAVLLGVESRPGRPQGWFVEAGLGGGVLAAAGWRVRRFQ